MNVLSLFDGISCARVALERAGIKVDKYYASEIDENAIKISKKNYKDIIHIGDVKNVNGFDYQNIGLLIGGSPCQDLSVAKRNRQGLQGERSSLFFEYARILREAKPKYFILENVASMKKEDRDIISKALGVEPIMINAALVSAQSRKRYFWTNIDVIFLPKDNEIRLKDIIIDGFPIQVKTYTLRSCFCKIGYSESTIIYKKPIQVTKINKGQSGRVYRIEGKSITLNANGGGGGAQTGFYLFKDYYRKLYPVECERLQGLPDCYTEGVSNTQRYKVLDNAFNVDVVAHILGHIK